MFNLKKGLIFLGEKGIIKRKVGKGGERCQTVADVWLLLLTFDWCYDELPDRFIST